MQTEAWKPVGVLTSHWVELALIVVCLVVSAIFAGSLWLYSKRRPALRLDESGGLAEELVLGFPLFVLFLAVTVQLILMMHARIVVNYAAFVTARSASVWVPACYNGERANSIRLTSQHPSEGLQLINTSAASSSKLERIRSAAVLACAPVSPHFGSWLSSYMGHREIAGLPTLPSLDKLNGPYQVALRETDSRFRDVARLRQIPRQVGRLVPRWWYSSIFTEVSFSGAEKASEISFPANGDITVTVEHKFYAQVPFVGRILGQRYRYLLENYSGGFLTSDTYYIPIRESYTIRNEGERLYPGYESCSQ